RRLCSEGLAKFRELGDGEGMSRALLALASSQTLLGRPDEALTLIEEGLAVAIELDVKEVVASFLDELAAVAAVGGDDGRAAELLGAAEALRDALGVLGDPQLDTHERILATLRSRVEGRALEEAL